MTHRAKHRMAALTRRVQQDRTIKSDLNPDGSQNEAYQAVAHRLQLFKSKAKKPKPKPKKAVTT